MSKLHSTCPVEHFGIFKKVNMFTPNWEIPDNKSTYWGNAFSSAIYYDGK